MEQRGSRPTQPDILELVSNFVDTYICTGQSFDDSAARPEGYDDALNELASRVGKENAAKLLTQATLARLYDKS